MIAEILREGKENATTARELAAFFHCEMRDITKQIQRERHEGAPILASVANGARGYFLPESEEEKARYCKSLKHRLDEMSATLAAVMKTETARRANA